MLPRAAQALSLVPRPAREVNKAVAGEPPGRALSVCCGQVAWAAVSQSPMILVMTGIPQLLPPIPLPAEGMERVLGMGSLKTYRKVSFQRTTSGAFFMSPPAPPHPLKHTVEEREKLGT